MVKSKKILGCAAFIYSLLSASAAMAQSRSGQWQQRAQALQAACGQDSQFPSTGTPREQFQWLRANESNANLSASCSSFIATEKHRHQQHEAAEQANGTQEVGPGGATR